MVTEGLWGPDTGLQVLTMELWAQAIGFQGVSRGPQVPVRYLPVETRGLWVPANGWQKCARELQARLDGLHVKVTDIASLGCRHMPWSR